MHNSIISAQNLEVHCFNDCVICYSIFSEPCKGRYSQTYISRIQFSNFHINMYTSAKGSMLYVISNCHGTNKFFRNSLFRLPWSSGTHCPIWLVDHSKTKDVVSHRTMKKKNCIFRLSSYGIKQILIGISKNVTICYIFFYLRKLYVIF